MSGELRPCEVVNSSSILQFKCRIEKLDFVEFDLLMGLRPVLAV